MNDPAGRPPGEADLDGEGAPFGLREPLPELFGEYLLVRRMPKGDVDRDVFIAKTTTLGGAERYCEVTILAPRAAGEAATLVARAQAAMQLSHRSVIPLLDAGEVEGRVYIATDLIRGIDLARLREALAEQPSTLSAAVELFLLSELLDGLDVAQHHHDPLTGAQAPVVHGGICPETLRITWQGEARLGGFGLPPPPSRTSLSCRAPEQLQGEQVDLRSDLFAIGVLVYEAAAGRSFYDGVDEAALPSIAARGGFAPAAWDQLEAALQHVLVKALHPDRTRRYPSAGAFRDDLLAWMQARGLSAGSADVRRFLDGRFVDVRRDEVDFFAQFSVVRHRDFSEAQAFESHGTDQIEAKPGSTDQGDVEPEGGDFTFEERTTPGDPNLLAAHTDVELGRSLDTDLAAMPVGRLLAPGASKSAGSTDEESKVSSAERPFVPEPATLEVKALPHATSLDANPLPLSREADTDSDLPLASDEDIELMPADMSPQATDVLPVLQSGGPTTEHAEPPLLSQSHPSLADPESGSFPPSHGLEVPARAGPSGGRQGQGAERSLLNAQFNRPLGLPEGLSPAPPPSGVNPAGDPTRERIFDQQAASPNGPRGPGDATSVTADPSPFLPTELEAVVDVRTADLLTSDPGFDDDDASGFEAAVPTEVVERGRPRAPAPPTRSRLVPVLLGAAGVAALALLVVALLPTMTGSAGSPAGGGAPTGITPGEAPPPPAPRQPGPSPAEAAPPAIADAGAASESAPGEPTAVDETSGGEADGEDPAPPDNEETVDDGRDDDLDERPAGKTRRKKKATKRPAGKAGSKRPPPPPRFDTLDDQTDYLKKWCTQTKCAAKVIKEGARWAKLDFAALRRLQAEANRCVGLCQR